MKTQLIPFNLDLLLLDEANSKTLQEINYLDIHDGLSKNFHPKGLFSTEIFGKVGEERRNRTFAYIDLRVEVLHPVLFKALCDLKELYGQIMAGKAFAVFDKSINDFVKVTSAAAGSTGYAFFMSYFDKLVFEERPSTKREFAIKLVNKYRKTPSLKRLIVMPAGLRDYVVDETGKPSEDEINTMYRKVLSITGALLNINITLDPTYLDSVRYNLQLAINDIYNYIINMLEGKSKLILGGWASRKTYDSTRNVITSHISEAHDLDSPKLVSPNQTVIPLYQYLRMTLPLTVKEIRDTYLYRVFPSDNSMMFAVNKKTLKKEMVPLDTKLYDAWMTYEGIEKTCAKFGEESLRHQVLETATHYLGLIYLGPDNTFRFMQDIDELPEGRSKKDVRPITFAEMLYISVYKSANEIPCFVTRYPITGYGSIYPSYVYLKSTVKGEVRYELDDNWIKSDKPAGEFPIAGLQFFNSMCPHASHLKRLGADFDGDTMSAQAVLLEESRAEIYNKLNDRSYYVGLDNEMIFSASTDIVEHLLASTTG